MKIKKVTKCLCLIIQKRKKNEIDAKRGRGNRQNAKGEIVDIQKTGQTFEVWTVLAGILRHLWPGMSDDGAVGLLYQLGRSKRRISCWGFDHNYYAVFGASFHDHVRVYDQRDRQTLARVFESVAIRS